MPVDVTVTNPDSSQATLVGGFTYAPELWTPAEITTALWLDADDSSTITTVSGAVSEWRDKSGNNRHVSQADAINRPAVSAGGLNSKDVLSFDGSNDVLSFAGSAFDVKNFLIVYFYKQVGGEIPLGLADGTEGNSDYLGIPGGDPINLYLRLGGRSDIRTRSAVGNNSWNVFSARALSTGNILRVNGSVNAATNSVGTYADTTYDRYFVGNRRQLNAYFSEGIAEIVALPTFDADIQDKAEGCLAHKWGLEEDLPAEHPYKSSPPTVTP